MKIFHIPPLDRQLEADLRRAIDNKTKPLGALGHLEEMALRIGLIQRTLTPVLHKPHILVFAGDHGIVDEGVSVYPQEVTYQMVMNFVAGGAAINVFSRQHGIDIKIVDAGVNYDFPSDLDLVHAKVAKGTKNFLIENAMTEDQCDAAMNQGAAIVSEIAEQGGNVIGFGEMGIGNTSSASLLMSHFCNMPVKDCVGRGAGLNDEQLHCKIKLLEAAHTRAAVDPSDPKDVLTAFGGFEIVMMCGAMLRAAQLNMIILVDGFITTAAFLAAYQFSSNIKDYAFFCHQSHEQGHQAMMTHLNARPLLDLGMRLGEGTAAALAYPLIVAAVKFLNEMASFESAGVSEKDV